MKRTIIEVTPAEGGGWEAREGEKGIEILVDDNKMRVVAAARRKAYVIGHSQLIIRTGDGKVQNEYTYDKGPPRYPS